MELKDQKRIEAPRERVYAALNDPDVLRACIPGCKSLEMVDDTHLDATVSLTIGPVKAKFDGHVELTDLHPPEHYTIVGEGKGGVAGFAKGSAQVHLAEEGPEATLLSYDAKAEVGGKLAQLGSRLIDSTAKKLANEFFTKFKATVEQPAAAAAPEPEAPAAAPPTPEAPAPEPAAAPATGTTGETAPQQPAAAPRPASETTGEAGRSGIPWTWIAIAAAVIVLIALVL